MKKSQLRKLIKEEVRRIKTKSLKEDSSDYYDSYDYRAWLWKQGVRKANTNDGYEYLRGLLDGAHDLGPYVSYEIMDWLKEKQWKLNPFKDISMKDIMADMVDSNEDEPDMEGDPDYNASPDDWAPRPSNPY